MTKNKEDLARSLGSRLSKIAKTKDIVYSEILTDFLIERLVVRLEGDAETAKKLIYKGGFVSFRVYESPRHTVDLDALLKVGDLDLTLKMLITAAERDANDGVWFRHEKLINLETQGEYGGRRIQFRAGVGEILRDIKRAQILHLDIGFGDPVNPGVISLESLSLLGDEKISWQVYPVETTVAEKLHALILRGGASSRSKDIFDLRVLIPRCKKSDLKKALNATFRHRETPVPSNFASNLKEINRSLLKMGWAKALRELDSPPKFDEAFDKLIELVAEFVDT